MNIRIMFLGLFLISQLNPAFGIQSPIVKQLGTMPPAFTQNNGQWADSILFRADAGGATMWFTRDGVYYQFTRRIAKPLSGEASIATDLGQHRPDMPDKFGREADSIETMLIKAEFVGASNTAEVIGLEEQDYKCNYFIGHDPSKWRTDVPNYSGVIFKGLYPGVEAVFRGLNGKLEYELR